MPPAREGGCLWASCAFCAAYLALIICRRERIIRSTGWKFLEAFFQTSDCVPEDCAALYCAALYCAALDFTAEGS